MMNADNTPPATARQRAWILVRFVLFGCVGVWIMLAFTLIFAMRFLENGNTPLSPFLSLSLAAVGALMTLYGVGEWGRWAYIWVFVSIPASICLSSLLPTIGTGILQILLVPAVVAFCTHAGVRAYYRHRVRAEPHDETQ